MFSASNSQVSGLQCCEKSSGVNGPTSAYVNEIRILFAGCDRAAVKSPRGVPGWWQLADCDRALRQTGAIDEIVDRNIGKANRGGGK
ncbi:MAG TPA: hypothetical protein PKH39_12745 [Woeseiaceae bacterium]|nr:hypothetical protein [Woeseiaceae bacterium]